MQNPTTRFGPRVRHSGDARIFKPLASGLRRQKPRFGKKTALGGDPQGETEKASRYRPHRGLETKQPAVCRRARKESYLMEEKFVLHNRRCLIFRSGAL
jgi:hypothetical protein